MHGFERRSRRDLLTDQVGTRWFAIDHQHGRRIAPCGKHTRDLDVRDDNRIPGLDQAQHASREHGVRIAWWRCGKRGWRTCGRRSEDLDAPVGRHQCDHRQHCNVPQYAQKLLHATDDPRWFRSCALGFTCALILTI
jgi:hypothetical protein